MCLIGYPCPNKRFPLKTRWDQVLTLKFRSMFTVPADCFLTEKSLTTWLLMHSSLFCHFRIKLNGSLVFCLKEQNWERKRERQRGGGGGREKKRKLEKRKEKKLLTSQIVLYTSTLSTTVYVGQGQILFFFFKVHIIALSNQQKQN